MWFSCSKAFIVFHCPYSIGWRLESVAWNSRHSRISCYIPASSPNCLFPFPVDQLNRDILLPHAFSFCSFSQKCSFLQSQHVQILQVPAQTISSMKQPISARDHKSFLFWILRELINTCLPAGHLHPHVKASLCLSCLLHGFLAPWWHTPLGHLVPEPWRRTLHLEVQ